MKKLIASTLAFGALTFAGSNAIAADVYLCAGQFNKTMSDGTSIPMWGFKKVANLVELAPGCSTAGGILPTVPGPALVNPDIDPNTGLPSQTPPVLSVFLYNDGIPEPISIIIPGQNDTTMTPVMFPITDPNYPGRLRSLTHETASGALGTYTWNSLKPGTYAYQSGTHQAVQVQMGLYGAMTKDLGAGFAYPGLAYDSKVTLLYSEIDPALHVAVASDNDTAIPPVNTFGPGSPMPSTVNYAPRYFLLNGEDIPTNNPVAGTVGQTVLIRMINMGLKNHMPTFQGVHLNVIAEDGNPYNYGKQQYAIHLAAGKTKDALLTLTTVGYIPFYDRRLFLTNKQKAGGIGVLALAPTTTTQPAGTLIANLVVTAAAVDTDGDGVADSIDNCTLVPNPAPQTDSDSDGFGNQCDGDFNNDNIVNTGDLNLFRAQFSSTNPVYDLNVDGVVNSGDLNILRGLFGKAPGPAAP